MDIDLTPEQKQALDSHPDEPIRAVDPVSGRENVLISREQYDRVGQGQFMSTSHVQQAVLPPPVPRRLADLPTPPEVTEEARRQFAARWKGWGGKSLSRIEQELKLQYYYGGRLICCLRDKEGLDVVIVHNGDDEEFHRQYQSLSPDQRRLAVSMSLPAWMDDRAELSSAFDNP